jgi:tetratricopeptide (TPR) repeat protein
MMRLDAGTAVFIDGVQWGASDANPVELRGLSAGLHNLTLIPTPDREYRFRLRLFSGPHVFDLTTGELKYVNAVGPSPAQVPAPGNLPPATVNDYNSFVQALWEERLILPAGNSAWDYYNRIQATLPPGVRNDLRKRLIIAMGNHAQRIVLRYVRGGDVRWNAAVFDEGAQLIARVRQLFRTFPEYQSEQNFFQGRALVERGQYVEAVQQLQQSIRVDPEASHSQNAIGLAFWKQNLFPAAIPPLQQAITLSPQWNYPRYTLALIYLEERRYDESEQMFQQALQNDAEDSTAHHGLGQLYALLGRFDEADARLQQAVQFNPGNAYAYNTYGKLQQRRGRIPEAEQMFRLAIRLEPDEPAFRASLADLLRANGRVPEAQTVFGQIANQATGNMQVLQSYSDFLASQNRTPEAMTLFQQAIRKSAKDANLRVLYGAFLKTHGQAKEAENQYKEGVKISKTNAFAHHELASLYIEQKKVREAEKELQLARDADPRFGAPPLLLGQIRFAQGRFAEALDEYRKALQLSIEASQQQVIRGFIADTEKTVVDQKLKEAKAQADRKQYAAAWNAYADLLKAAGDSAPARDAALGFQYDHPTDADPAKLPNSGAGAAIQTTFWRTQVEAEQNWRSNRKDEAIQKFVAALENLSPKDRQMVTATAFNVRNDLYGIHQVVYRWAGRVLEMQKWQDAIRLMDIAAQQNIFVQVGTSPLTIDSLMWPADVAQPREVKDFEIAHHPDRRAHEIYAAGYAGLNDWERAKLYLAVLQPTPADLSQAVENIRKWLPPGTELKIQ